MRQSIAGTIIVGLSTAFLWHFSNIWLFGSLTIGEPNVLWLVFETLLVVLCLAFGLYLFVDWLKSSREQEER